MKILITGAAGFIGSLLGTMFFAGLYGMGYRVPIRYDAHWHPLITAMGYVSLTLFAGILGFIIEGGRKSAFQRMEHALKNLRFANDQLEALNQEKTHILQVVAHDLRSPLQAILGHGALIADGFVTDLPQVQSSGGHIVKTSRRMSRLIDDLLDLNSMEEGRFSLNIERVDFTEMIVEAVQQHRFVAKNKDITLEVHSPEATVFVFADAKPTLQILDNLLSNAVKYSPKGSTTHIALEVRENFAVLSVKDEGPGLSEEDQAKLFQKFTRLTSQPTGGESSSGLGLSIAKKMTESMGGTIGCRSQLGAGSTFFIELPLSG